MDRYQHCEFFEQLKDGNTFRLEGELFTKVSSIKATGRDKQWWYLFNRNEIIEASPNWNEKYKELPGICHDGEPCDGLCTRSKECIKKNALCHTVQ
jgi:hypothetical protein